MSQTAVCSLWNWLALSVENLAEDAYDDFFIRVLHNENYVLHPLLPEHAMNVGYSYVPNAILYRDS